MTQVPSWLEVAIPATEIEGDAIIALLDDLPFNSFMEADEQLLAYLSSDDWSPEMEVALESILGQYGLAFTCTILPATNWNSAWESNFPPVTIDGVCHILASFHEPPETELPIISITPKMAFGTGHHETTSGMLQEMNRLEWAGKEVLDFGSGTGILAIFAAMKGAREILAIDIEVPSYENMQENFAINEVAFIEASLGGKEVIPEDRKYDIILANITANVILDSLNALSKVLRTGGKVLMSGFFENDLIAIEQTALALGWRRLRYFTEGRWVIAHFES